MRQRLRGSGCRAIRQQQCQQIIADGQIERLVGRCRVSCHRGFDRHGVLFVVKSDLSPAPVFKSANPHVVDSYNIVSGFLRFCRGNVTGLPTRWDSNTAAIISVAARAL